MMSCLYLIGAFLFVHVAAEYQIWNKEQDIPSYLKGSIIDPDGRDFPYSLNIKMKLVEIEGTLVYGMDSLGNQLIVSVNDNYLFISYRGEKYPPYNLKEICDCRYECLFEELNLFITVKDKMYFSCNTRKMVELLIKSEKKINNMYPKLSFKSGKSPNIIKLFVGNHPAMNKVKNDYFQSRGCILSVKHAGEEVNLTSHGKGIRKGECERACKNESICNSGACIETFKANDPLCDCSRSLYGGSRCNKQNLQKHNRKYLGKFNPKMLKLVWENNTGRIMEISNKVHTFKIYENSSRLYMKYMYVGSDMYSTTNVRILKNYTKLSRYMAILTFLVNNIEVELQSQTQKPIKNDIRIMGNLTKTYFTSLSLYSDPEGAIDVEQKLKMTQRVWKDMDLNRYSNEMKDIITTDTLITTTDISITTTATLPSTVSGKVGVNESKYTTTIFVNSEKIRVGSLLNLRALTDHTIWLVILCGIVLISWIVLIVMFYNYRRLKVQVKSYDSDTPLIIREDIPS